METNIETEDHDDTEDTPVEGIAVFNPPHTERPPAGGAPTERAVPVVALPHDGDPGDEQLLEPDMVLDGEPEIATTLAPRVGTGTGIEPEIATTLAPRIVMASS